MTRLEALQELLDAVRKADTHTKRLGGLPPHLIREAIADDDEMVFAFISAYVGHLNEAIDFAQSVLPGASYEIKADDVSYAVSVELTNWRPKGQQPSGVLYTASTPARAMLLATLVALIEKEAAGCPT